MSTGDRAVRLDRLRHVESGERGVLSNARCLGEGVDVPTLDGVAFIDPRHSQVDIVQAVGRAIRKAEGKEVATILIPVFVDPTLTLSTRWTHPLSGPSRQSFGHYGTTTKRWPRNWTLYVANSVDVRRGG